MSCINLTEGRSLSARPSWMKKRVTARNERRYLVGILNERNNILTKTFAKAAVLCLKNWYESFTETSRLCCGVERTKKWVDRGWVAVKDVIQSSAKPNNWSIGPWPQLMCRHNACLKPISLFESPSNCQTADETTVLVPNTPNDCLSKGIIRQFVNIESRSLSD